MFGYDPDTGAITRLVRMGNYSAGTVCQSPNTEKRYIKVRNMLAHRLAWYLHTGEQPPKVIDHIKGDGFDNRWCNLRAATTSSNQMNIGVTSKSQTGIKGVFPIRAGKLYRAEVCVNGARHQKHSKDPAKLEAWVIEMRHNLHEDFAHN